MWYLASTKRINGHLRGTVVTEEYIGQLKVNPRECSFLESMLQQVSVYSATGLPNTKLPKLISLYYAKDYPRRSDLHMAWESLLILYNIWEVPLSSHSNQEFLAYHYTPYAVVRQDGDSVFFFMMNSHWLAYWMSLVATDSSRLKQRRSSASLFSQPERMRRGVSQLFRGLLVSNITTSCCWRVRIEAAESLAWPPPKIGTSELGLEVPACGSDLRNH